MSLTSKDHSDQMTNRETELKETLKKMASRETELLNSLGGLPPNYVAIKRLELSNLMMDMISYHILLNDLSKTIQSVKSEFHLNEARKLAYKAIIYLEEVVTDYIDVPFSDYSEKLKLIQKFPDKERLNLMNKLGLSIQMIIDNFGENSKWKWSYTELKGRYAVVLKNIIDLKKYVVEFDPRSEGYQERFMLMSKAKKMLNEVADSYRQKYELTSQRLDDMKLAIAYLSSLRRIHGILSESEDADEVKKKIEVWKTKMDDDDRKHSAKNKKDRISAIREKSDKKKKGFLGL